MTAGAMPSPFETILTGLVHASWQAAVLALVVLVVSLVLREQLEPRWRFCLWLVVLVRLALPVIPSAPWSIFGLMKTAPEAQTTSRQPETFADPSALLIIPNASSDSTLAPPEPMVAANPDSVGPVDQEIEPDRKALDPSPLTLEIWLAIAWLAGLFVVLFRFGWSSLLLLREKRSWHEITDPTV